MLKIGRLKEEITGGNVENEIQQDINVLIKRRFEELEELKSKGIETFAYSFDVN